MADEKMKEKKAEEEWEKYRNERKLYWWTRSDEEDAKRIYIDGFRKGQNLCNCIHTDNSEVIKALQKEIETLKNKGN